MKQWIAAAVLALCVSAWGEPATNATVSVSWSFPTENISGSPLTDLGGAKIYYGTASSNYTHVIDAGTATNLTIIGLAFGKTYYVNGTCYNTAGMESDYTVEVTKTTKEKPKPLGPFQ